ncbi:DUF29 domain-containing protein [Oscillatoria salina]|uniref:DUF29 domain-containing protein n=1 Tax=Oscillatoria salina TaxID=331517 RepID=UPI001CCBC400|nr:DUF29 domain-containing protein [Oscillatoria salina]MBZ8181269.1 DUF29 domain-containing protein [Oscillatoria salina IIICB1]
MTKKLETQLRQLYEIDYLKWIETTLEKLRNQDYSAIDWDNLIDEIEDMGKRERRSLKSNLIVVLTHFLKWQYQPELRSSSWKGSIVEHRRRIRESLQDSPSLKAYLETVFSQCYADAIAQATAETELPKETFPEVSPYTLMQVFDANFLPGKDSI